jgi:hypothetical protein
MAQKKKIVIEDENDKRRKTPASTPSDPGAATDETADSPTR